MEKCIQCKAYKATRNRQRPLLTKIRSENGNRSNKGRQENEKNQKIKNYKPNEDNCNEQIQELFAMKFIKQEEPIKILDKTKEFKTIILQISWDNSGTAIISTTCVNIFKTVCFVEHFVNI